MRVSTLDGRLETSREKVCRGSGTNTLCRPLVGSLCLYSVSADYEVLFASYGAKKKTEVLVEVITHVQCGISYLQLTDSLKNELLFSREQNVAHGNEYHVM